MEKFFLIAFSMLLFTSCTKMKQEVEFVNPLIGTPFAGFSEKLEGGGTMPCVGLPFAMTNFVAQTRENKMSRMVYVYEDSTVIGFTATHQPTVWMGDYGYVSVMPQTGRLKVLPGERILRFSHKDEISKPYYYSVDLQAGDNKIKSEIAAASRCGMFQFTFPQSDESHLIIQGINLNPELTDWANDYSERLNSLTGYVKIDPGKKEIYGYNPDRMSSQLGPELPNFKGYFIIQSDKQFESFGTWSGTDPDGIRKLGIEQYGTRMGAYISFKTKKNEKVKVKVATSFISLDQARMNLSVEIPGWDFREVVKNTRDVWQENLSRIKIKGATEDQKAVFYTALFHTMLFPREFSEYGRYYSAFDDQVHEGDSYNDFSLWDTFRALHPLLQFTQPERVSPMVRALLQMYREGGWLPKWPNPAYTNIMIGTHADAVIADAYVNGFRDYDIHLAYEAIRKNAMVPPDGDKEKMWGDRDRWTSYEARGGLSYYHSLGYVPVDKTKESVSRTVEFGIDDYCVAQMAKDLGKQDDYEVLVKNSKNYRNLYHPETGFMTARLSDGSWHVEPPRPENMNTHTHPPAGFTEGSEWTYLFGAMHDRAGMIELMGGREQFAARLEENFKGGHYRHDNEPGHHYLYLFNDCGMPWRTQELVRKHTSEENFRNEPRGINGNDDCGQMSAWYVFGVMGFYPVTPASGMYSIGAPQFPELVIHFPVGNQSRKLRILAVNLSEKNKYVQKVTLDGVPLSVPYISRGELIRAEKLIFEMGPEPCYHWK